MVMKYRKYGKDEYVFDWKNENGPPHVGGTVYLRRDQAEYIFNLLGCDEFLENDNKKGLKVTIERAFGRQYFPD